ncbi:hypothetical protein ACVBEJ_05845 [Porticoccus sp. GXU_MW_L64]
MYQKIVLVALLFLTGCASQVPEKRPFLSEYGEIKDVGVEIFESNGVETTYYYGDSSAIGYQYGLIGAITTSIIDAASASGPAARAEDTADSIAEIIDPDKVTEALKDIINESRNSLDRVQTVGDATVVSEKKGDTEKNRLFLNVSYYFLPDFSAFEAQAIVTLDARNVLYKNPYVDDDNKNTKKDNLIYKNKFAYQSDTLHLPVSIEHLKSEVKSKKNKIKDKYRGKNNVLPSRGTQKEKEMRQELRKINFERLKNEVMLNQWLADDAKLIWFNIHEANKFIMGSLIQDLKAPEIPVFKNGKDDVIVETAFRRDVKIGNGYHSGSYHSSPINKRNVLWNTKVSSKAAEEKKSSNQEHEKKVKE